MRDAPFGTSEGLTDLLALRNLYQRLLEDEYWRGHDSRIL